MLVFDAGSENEFSAIFSLVTRHHTLAGRRVIRVARTAPELHATPVRTSTRTHDDKVRIRMQSASDGTRTCSGGTRTQKKSFPPKIEIGLENGSSAAFFNYVTTAMCDGHLAPTTFPCIDDPGRGHERPAPAIVFGKNGEILEKIFVIFFEN